MAFVGARLLVALTFLHTFRTAGAADLVNSNLFLQVSGCDLTHQLISSYL